MYKAGHHLGWIWDYNLLLPACQHHDKIPKIPPETYTTIYMGIDSIFQALHYNLYGDSILFFNPYTTLASKPTL